jgi:hypothetical protein
MSWRREPSLVSSSPINPSHPENRLGCRTPSLTSPWIWSPAIADVDGDMQPLVAHDHQHAPAARAWHRGNPLTYPPGFGQVPGESGSALRVEMSSLR